MSLAAVCLLAEPTPVDGGGPHNVVGHFTGQLMLRCDRDTSAGAAAVTWRYIAPGSDSVHDQPVPGRHSYSGSNYGRHSLRLENLQRSDAGLYVCRSSDDPQSFHPASAFVVVVAQSPVCRADYNAPQLDGGFTLSCLITYNGLLNLTLSILRREDNRTVASRNYTSAVGGSWWRLDAEVPRANFTGPSVCRAKFYSSRTEPDVAKNRPRYIEAACEPPPPGFVVQTRSTGDPRTAEIPTTTVTPIASVNQPSTTSADGYDAQDIESRLYKLILVAVPMSAAALILVLLLLIISTIIVAFFFIRRYRRNRRATKRRDGREDGRERRSEEQCVVSRSSELLAGDDDVLNAPLTSSAGSVTVSCCRGARELSSARYHVDTTNAVKRGGPSDVQPSSSASASAMDLSLRSSVDEVSLHNVAGGSNRTGDDAAIEVHTIE